MHAGQDYGPWFLFWLFATILVWEEVWDLPHTPYLSAWLLLIITAGAMVCSWIFERRLWCRYLCPIGGMNGLFAKLSVTELRAKQGVCHSKPNLHPASPQGTPCTSSPNCFFFKLSMHCNCKMPSWSLDVACGANSCAALREPENPVLQCLLFQACMDMTITCKACPQGRTSTSSSSCTPVCQYAFLPACSFLPLSFCHLPSTCSQPLLSLQRTSFQQPQ